MADEQSDRELDLVRWEALARNVLGAEGVSGAAELALMFVDEPTMAELNGTFMGETGPTDVLSFPIDATDEIGTGRSPDGSTTGPDRPIPDDLVYDETTFHHPVFDLAAIRAQEGIGAIQGATRTWYAGAWLRNGFHEDGIASAMRVARTMGVPAW